MKNTNSHNLKDLNLDSIKGTSFISLEYESEPKSKKGWDGRIKKRTTTQAMISNTKNVNTYQNMVNRRLEQEGKKADFKVSKPVWGTKESTGISVHTKADGTTTRYLEFIVIGKYESVYLLDGVEVSDDVVSKHLYATSKPKQGELENTVKYRKVKLENIKKLKALRQTVIGDMHYES